MDVEKGREMRSIINLEISRFTLLCTVLVHNMKQPAAGKLVAPGQSCILILHSALLRTQ
jgi:hypothetical protein